jgi:ferric-dicitrate binding protein FerR (iron transport regulator)
VTDELFEKYLSNRLSGDEVAELKRLLAGGKPAREQFVHALQEWQLYAEAARQVTAGMPAAGLPPDDAAAKAVLDTARRRRPSLRVLPLPRRARPGRLAALVLLPAAALAACVALMVMLPGQAQKGEPLGLLALVQPGVVLQRGDTRLSPALGAGLQPGDILIVPAGAHAAMRYGDDTRLDLGPGTTLTLVAATCAPGAAEGAPGKRVTVSAGQVTAEVAKQPPGHPMQFLTPGAQATVLGTRLTLEVAAAATRLEVEHGLVGLSRRNDRTMVKVAAGQFATVADGIELASRPLAAEQAGSSEAEHHPGIKAEYFADTGLSKLMFTRTDPTVSYDPGLEAPPLDISPSHFSVRWSGLLLPRFSETYVLHLHADSGVRLTVDGKVLIEDVAASVVSDHQVALPCEAGKHYPLRIEYIQPKSGMMIKFLWESAHQPLELVPAERLSPDP